MTAGPVPPAVIGYLRVSTDDQVDGFGLEVQRAKIEAFCNDHGFVLSEVFSDEGVSGATPFSSRPGLSTALLRLAEDGLVGLVVASLDRLARHLGEQEACLAHVWRTEHKVFASDVGEITPDDADDPMRTAMRQMMGVFAQLERGMIVARMRGGRRAKRDAGGWWSGAPPYGWRAEKGELVEVPEEREVVAWILRQREGGFTYSNIVDRLNAAGTPGPRGGRWHASAVKRIVATGLDKPKPKTARDSAKETAEHG